jgi:hypothetical protein
MGVQSRSRTITRAANHGGQACSGLSQTQNCNTQPCPIDCVFIVHAWQPCSLSCGGGVQTRPVTVVADAFHNGVRCPTESQRVCNVAACPTPVQKILAAANANATDAANAAKAAAEASAMAVQEILAAAKVAAEHFTVQQNEFKYVRGSKSASQDDAQSTATCGSGWTLLACRCQRGAACDGTYISWGTTCRAVNGIHQGGAIAEAECVRNTMAFSSTSTAALAVSDVASSGWNTNPSVSCLSGYTLTGCSCYSPWRGCTTKNDGAQGTMNGNTCSVQGSKCTANARCVKANAMEVQAILAAPTRMVAAAAAQAAAKGFWHHALLPVCATTSTSVVYDGYMYVTCSLAPAPSSLCSLPPMLLLVSGGSHARPRCPPRATHEP